MGSCLGKCLLKSESLLRQSRQNSEHDFVFLINDKSENNSVEKRNFLSNLFKKRKSLKHPKMPVLELVDGLINPQTPLYSRLNESQRLPSTSTCCSHDIPLQCLDARVLLAKTRTSTPASSIDLEWEHETLPISMVHDPSATSSWTNAFPGDDLTTDPCASFCCCGEDVTASVATHDTGDCALGDGAASAAAAANTADTERSWSRISSANSLEWDNNVPATINLLHMVHPLAAGGDPVTQCAPPFTEDQSEPISSTAEVDEAAIGGEVFEQVDLELDEADALQLLSEIERLTKRTLEETGKDLDCASANS